MVEEGWGIVEQVGEEAGAVVEEAACDLPGVGLVEGDLVDAAAVEGEDLGAGGSRAGGASGW